MLGRISRCIASVRTSVSRPQYIARHVLDMCGPQLIRKSFSTSTTRLQARHITSLAHAYSAPQCKKAFVHSAHIITYLSAQHPRAPLNKLFRVGLVRGATAELTFVRRLTFSCSIVRLSHLSSDYQPSAGSMLFCRQHGIILRDSRQNHSCVINKFSAASGK